MFVHFEIEIVELVTLRRIGTDASHIFSGLEQSKVLQLAVKEGSSAKSITGATRNPVKLITERRHRQQRVFLTWLAEVEKASSTTQKPL